MPHKYHTKILKTISFIHSDLQIHYLSVVLQHLPERKNTIQSELSVGNQCNLY